MKIIVNKDRSNLSETFNIPIERTEALKEEFALVLQKHLTGHTSDVFEVWEEIFNVAQNEQELVFITIMFQGFLEREKNLLKRPEVKPMVSNSKFIN